MCVKLLDTEHMSLHQCSDGYWLYDKQLGMNLAMRALDEREALLDALTYYQERYTRAQTRIKDLESKVLLCVQAFRDDPVLSL